jgi:hypothetical protein
LVTALTAEDAGVRADGDGCFLCSSGLREILSHDELEELGDDDLVPSYCVVCNMFAHEPCRGIVSSMDAVVAGIDDRVMQWLHEHGAVEMAMHSLAASSMGTFFRICIWCEAALYSARPA